MKCPLLCIGRKYEVGALYPKGGDCLKKECALWHDGLEDCSLFLIQEYLALIMAQLEKVNKA